MFENFYCLRSVLLVKKHRYFGVDSIFANFAALFEILLKTICYFVLV